MIPSPVNLSTVPPYCCTTTAARLTRFGHDLAQPLCTHGCCDVHRVNNVGEQHRYLLVLRRSSGVCERCTALVTELGVRRQFGAAGSTEQPRRGQSTATIPAGVHVSIVSPLVNGVRHIAVPSPTRSFETLVCRIPASSFARSGASGISRAIHGLGWCWRCEQWVPYRQRRASDQKAAVRSTSTSWPENPRQRTPSSVLAVLNADPMTETVSWRQAAARPEVSSLTT